MVETDPLVWAVDDDGRRHLCPFSSLGNANHVDESEKRYCIGDDSALASRRFVPSNDTLEKVKFPHSVSLN